MSTTLVLGVIVCGLVIAGVICLAAYRSIRYKDYKNENENLKEYFKNEKQIQKKHYNVLTNLRVAFDKRLDKLRKNDK